MSALVSRASRRHFVRHPGQLLLGLAGLALGVAVIVAIHTTRESARAAFDLTGDLLVGRATHRITGGAEGVPFRVFRGVRRELGIAASAPVIETRVSLPARGARLTLLAVDPLAEFRLRSGFGTAGEAVDPAALMTEPGAAWLSGTTAARFGISLGDRVALGVRGREKTVRIAGLAGGAEPWLPDGVLVVDLATGEELLGSRGRLSRIDLRLGDGVPGAREVEAWLPEGVTIKPVAATVPDLDELTRAFYTNLTALGLLALLVGMFLVFSTQSFLVTQRRELFGTLRALGATRAQIARVVLTEAAVLGVLGGVIGVAVGYALSHLMLAQVTTTLNDLYSNVAVSALSLPPGLALAALLIGTAAAVAASAAALATAGGTPVEHMARIALEARAARGGRIGALAGVVLMLAAWPIVAATGRALLGGFAGLFAFALGAALVTPALLRQLLVLAAGAARGFALHHAITLARGSLSRTGVACAALMLAAATGIGVTTMVASFRSSVDDWLTRLLRADLYVSVDGATEGVGGGPFPATLPARLTERPEISAATTVRRARSELIEGSPAAPVPVALAAYRLHRAAFDGFELLAGDAETAWRRFAAPDAVMVSEPFAFHHALAPGAEVTLATPQGPRVFEVTGIYRDYGNERGTVALSAATFARWFADTTADGLGLFAAPGVSSAALEQAAREVLPADVAWTVTDAASIRRASLEVFDRTFVVTEALRNLALVIACAGMFSSLLALGLERTRVLATYRALGTGARTLLAMLVTESGTVGLAAGLVAVPVGLGLAIGLIEVINVRSFGWSMGLTIPATGILAVVAAAGAAALAAGVYPAWRAARTSLPEALRSE